MLNEMRFGRMSDESVAAFKALSRPPKYDDLIVPTELFPRREDVERSNTARLNALDEMGYSYTATDGGAVTDPTQREKVLANFMAPQFIEVKEKAQVMLIKNVDESLVNGSMGTVIGFAHKHMYVTDLQGRWLKDGDVEGLDENEREKKEKLRLLQLSKVNPGVKPLPIVEFRVPGGVRDMLVEHDVFKTELPNGEVQVSRNQVSFIRRYLSGSMLIIIATYHLSMGYVYS